MKRPLGVEPEIGFLCLRHVTCMYIMNIDVTTWSFFFHNVRIRNDHDELNFEISSPREIRKQKNAHQIVTCCTIFVTNNLVIFNVLYFVVTLLV